MCAQIVKRPQRQTCMHDDAGWHHTTIWPIMDTVMQVSGCRHDSLSIDLPTIYVIGSIDVNKAHICVCLNKGYPTLRFRILYTEKCWAGHAYIDVRSQHMHSYTHTYTLHKLLRIHTQTHNYKVINTALLYQPLKSACTHCGVVENLSQTYLASDRLSGTEEVSVETNQQFDDLQRRYAPYTSMTERVCISAIVAWACFCFWSISEGEPTHLSEICPGYIAYTFITA